MEPWQQSIYATESASNRQPRHNSSAHATPQHQAREFNASTQHQIPAGFSYEPYPNSSSSQPQSMVTSPTGASGSRHNEISPDYMDVQMQDADPYNRAKYPRANNQQSGSSSALRGVGQYMAPEESSASQRYSPMGSTLSPQSPYTSSGQGAYGSYQGHRQSPSRSNNYSSNSQSYYANQSGSGSPRIGAPSQSASNFNPLSSSNSVSHHQRPNQLPSLQPGDSSNDPYYSQSAITPQGRMFGGEPRSPRHLMPHPQNPTADLDSVPRFTRLKSVHDLQPKTNAQPPFRRAHPEGGFISVRWGFPCSFLRSQVPSANYLLKPLQALTTHLPSTYRICNPNFKYESSRNPRRVLTKPSKGVKNDGYDNEDSDYILYVNDILGSEETGHKYVLKIHCSCYSKVLTHTTKESLPYLGCLGPRHIWSGRQMSEFEDSGGGGCQGGKKPDGVLQSEHDGGIGA